MESKLIFKTISYISFAFFIVTGAAAFGQTHKFAYVNDYYTVFWDIFATKEIMSKKVVNFPVENMNYFLYILFSILLLLEIISLVMLIKFRNEESIEEGMFDKYSRFHFIPLLCGASLYIIGESFSSEGLVKDPNSPFVFSIIISVIGLASLIFIYFKTNIESHTYSRLIIKKASTHA